MNIVVINGSPKTKYSITLQTVLYIERNFPDHSFDYINAASVIRQKDKKLPEVIEKIKQSDAVLFSYPVYTFIAPSQLHALIEMLKESGADLSGRFFTQITTSKHFYDTTAHKYIEENGFDMGMKYIRGLSADMDDLLTEKGQKQAKDFFSRFLWCAENGICEPNRKAYTEPKRAPVTPLHRAPSSGSGDVVIVTDLKEDDVQLNEMIKRFRAVMPEKTRLVNLRDFHFSGGCLGCFNCAVSGKCIYKDRFDDFLRNNIQTADATVYAFSIKDHSMGTLFKTYDDRQFCNGHRTVTMGKPVGYLVSGNYGEEDNLRMIIEGRAQVGGNYLAGVATDETDPDGEIDRMAQNLHYALINGYEQPAEFLGVGGMKIFRDLIYQMRGMMKADHKFYKEHGQYDFPQKTKGRNAAMYLVGAMLSSDTIRKNMGNKMNEGMLLPYKKV
ncbi:MAG: NAD(P)H-dependent oxidoreductase [Clostridia bacterium]|nr:NAD(P)H-dependent oxidoreductase [Clostridia bacterium]